uniref:Uncharacterized protein n=1 Tax=Ananas comosus var. bracteatus TaxID=296719 RepID=A0A6V7NT12_ANACO|nr:unnamed protein product [Ananas comosus var. bracteatus]
MVLQVRSKEGRSPLWVLTVSVIEEEEREKKLKMQLYIIPHASPLFPELGGSGEKKLGLGVWSLLEGRSSTLADFLGGLELLLRAFGAQLIGLEPSSRWDWKGSSSHLELVRGFLHYRELGGLWALSSAQTNGREETWWLFQLFISAHVLGLVVHFAKDALYVQAYGGSGHAPGEPTPEAGSGRDTEYEREFSRLLHCVPFVVRDDEDKARIFERGFRPSIYRLVQSSNLQTYRDMVNRVLIMESGAADLQERLEGLDKGKGKSPRLRVRARRTLGGRRDTRGAGASCEDVARLLSMEDQTVNRLRAA